MDTHGECHNKRARWRKPQLKAYNTAIECLDLPRDIEPKPWPMIGSSSTPLIAPRQQQECRAQDQRGLDNRSSVGAMQGRHRRDGAYLAIRASG